MKEAHIALAVFLLLFVIPFIPFLLPPQIRDYTEALFLLLYNVTKVIGAVDDMRMCALCAVTGVNAMEAEVDGRVIGCGSSEVYESLKEGKSIAEIFEGADFRIRNKLAFVRLFIVFYLLFGLLFASAVMDFLQESGLIMRWGAPGIAISVVLYFSLTLLILKMTDPIYIFMKLLNYSIISPVISFIVLFALFLGLFRFLLLNIASGIAMGRKTVDEITALKEAVSLEVRKGMLLDEYARRR